MADIKQEIEIRVNADLVATLEAAGKQIELLKAALEEINAVKDPKEDDNLALWTHDDEAWERYYQIAFEQVQEIASSALKELEAKS